MTFLKKILFLDFDGTLAPIARTPDAVALSPRVRKVLKRLAGSADTKVCIVSGRSVRDLKRVVPGRRFSSI